MAALSSPSSLIRTLSISVASLPAFGCPIKHLSGSLISPPACTCCAVTLSATNQHQSASLLVWPRKIPKGCFTIARPDHQGILNKQTEPSMFEKESHKQMSWLALLWLQQHSLWQLIKNVNVIILMEIHCRNSCTAGQNVPLLLLLLLFFPDSLLCFYLAVLFILLLRERKPASSGVKNQHGSKIKLIPIYTCTLQLVS